jgi:myo-inositol-1(or 4)-monophosphatase
MNFGELLEICRRIREEIKREIHGFSQEELSKEVGMGKDGTPTKKVDRIAEDIALKILKEREFTIVSEEAGIVGNGNVYVALDPIDGTFNASRSIPIYAISLCFSKSEFLGDSFFAYVANLATEAEYYSIGRWGAGESFKNGKRIRVSSTNTIYCNAIFYYPNRNYGFKRFRIFGSAALELCFVADGSVDVFIDIRSREDLGFLRIYDVAAGLLICRNAGAKATDASGESLERRRFTMDERLTLIVANENLHDKIIKSISIEKAGQ